MFLLLFSFSVWNSLHNHASTCTHVNSLDLSQGFPCLVYSNLSLIVINEGFIKLLGPSLNLFLGPTSTETLIHFFFAELNKACPWVPTVIGWQSSKYAPTSVTTGHYSHYSGVHKVMDFILRVKVELTKANKILTFKLAYKPKIFYCTSFI